MPIKKLSTTGKTEFIVTNIDHAFLIPALNHYANSIKDVKWPTNNLIPIMTKESVLNRISSLQQTFKVEEE